MPADSHMPQGHDDQCCCSACLTAMLSASPARGEGDAPVEVTIFCPVCAVPHVDEGEWATTRHHKTHQCQSCGHEWRPFPFATVGVAHPAPEQAGEGDAPGLTVEIVDGPPPLPGVPSYAIRKWDNHGLKAGTYRLFTRHTPATPEGLREKVARAACAAILEQDFGEEVELGEDLTISYLDQGAVDFGKVADAILAALQPQAEGGE